MRHVLPALTDVAPSTLCPLPAVQGVSPVFKVITAATDPLSQVSSSIPLCSPSVLLEDLICVSQSDLSAVADSDSWPMPKLFHVTDVHSVASSPHRAASCTSVPTLGGVGTPGLNAAFSVPCVSSFGDGVQSPFPSLPFFMGGIPDAASSPSIDLPEYSSPLLQSLDLARTAVPVSQCGSLAFDSLPLKLVSPLDLAVDIATVGTALVVDTVDVLEVPLERSPSHLSPPEEKVKVEFLVGSCGVETCVSVVPSLQSVPAQSFTSSEVQCLAVGVECSLSPSAGVKMSGKRMASSSRPKSKVRKVVGTNLVTAVEATASSSLSSNLFSDPALNPQYHVPDSWEQLAILPFDSHNCGPHVPCDYVPPVCLSASVPVFTTSEGGVSAPFLSQQSLELAPTFGVGGVPVKMEQGSGFTEDVNPSERLVQEFTANAAVPFDESMQMDQDSLKRSRSGSDSEARGYASKRKQCLPGTRSSALQPRVVLLRCDEVSSGAIVMTGSPPPAQGSVLGVTKPLEAFTDNVPVKVTPTLRSPGPVALLPPPMSSDEDGVQSDASSLVSDVEDGGFGDLPSEDGSEMLRERLLSYSSTKFMRAGVWIRKSPARKVEEYIPAVQAVVGDEDGVIIQFGAPNPRRLEFYLCSEELASRCIEHGLTLDGEYIPVYGLVDRAARVVLSQIPYWFPSSLLVESLEPYGRCTEEGITPLKLSVSFKGMTNVLSFRREVLLRVSAHHKSLPTELVVVYQERRYSFPVVEGRVTCYACRAKGHIAARCPHKKRKPQVPVVVSGPVILPPLPANPPPVLSADNAAATASLSKSLGVKKRSLVLKNALIRRELLPAGVDAPSTESLTAVAFKAKTNGKSWADITAEAIKAEAQHSTVHSFSSSSLVPQAGRPGPLHPERFRTFVGDKLTPRREALPSERVMKVLIKPTGDVLRWPSYRSRVVSSLPPRLKNEGSLTDRQLSDVPNLLPFEGRAGPDSVGEMDTDARSSPERRPRRRYRKLQKTIDRTVLSTRDDDDLECLTIVVGNTLPSSGSVCLSPKPGEVTDSSFPPLSSVAAPFSASVGQRGGTNVVAVSNSRQDFSESSFRTFASRLKKTSLQCQSDGVASKTLRTLDIPSFKVMAHRFKSRLEDIGLWDEACDLLDDVLRFKVSSTGKPLQVSEQSLPGCHRHATSPIPSISSHHGSEGDNRWSSC